MCFNVRSCILKCIKVNYFSKIFFVINYAPIKNKKDFILHGFKLIFDLCIFIDILQRQFQLTKTAFFFSCGFNRILCREWGAGGSEERE